MTKDQALKAIELLGGINSTARLIKNALGQPINRPNLSKAINNARGVPDWLSVQLVDALNQHKLDVDRLLLDL